MTVKRLATTNMLQLHSESTFIVLALRAGGHARMRFMHPRTPLGNSYDCTTARLILNGIWSLRNIRAEINIWCDEYNTPPFSTGLPNTSWPHRYACVQITDGLHRLFRFEGVAGVWGWLVCRCLGRGRGLLMIGVLTRPMKKTSTCLTLPLRPLI